MFAFGKDIGSREKPGCNFITWVEHNIHGGDPSRIKTHYRHLVDGCHIGHKGDKICDDVNMCSRVRAYESRPTYSSAAKHISHILLKIP